MDERVRRVTKAETAREMEISLSTLDRRIRRGRSRFAGRDAGSTCGWRGRSTWATTSCCVDPLVGRTSFSGRYGVG